MKLTGKVVVVTGASRGIGKGVALVLGAQGATVYVTGRTQAPGENLFPGTIHETAEAITAAGGTGIAVACDHANDDEVKGLFERITSEQGHMDILVNNVTALAPDVLNPPPFWTKSLRLADQIVVGLRSAYVSSYYAAPLLLQSKKALVANISFYGAVSYVFDPAYGATKAGLDKMTWDMAQDFKPHGVAVVSIWPGPTMTEMTISRTSQIPGGDKLMEAAETPQFTGRVIEALHGDPNLIMKSGQVVIGAEAAVEYGFTDINSRQPPRLRHKLGSPQPYFSDSSVLTRE
jgi:NAD(P)-dependent dehydrogenase (short-subunit alcohol dehydrogenase family)